MPADRGQALRRRALQRRRPASEARANREVIVSAGAINSPQLLELSGIGQPELLQSLGIEVRHALKGVGENLRDHYAPRMKWAVPPSLGLTYNDKGRGLGLVWQALKYALTHKGLLGLPASPIRAYVRTRAGLDAPDAGISWVPFLIGPNFKLAKNSGITAIMHILRSESTGSIHASSKAPRTPPAIRFNFLTAQLDREVTLEAMRITRRIMTAPAMQGIAADEMAPGVNIQADDEMLDWVRNNAETAYHPVGTCKMGRTRWRSWTTNCVCMAWRGCVSPMRRSCRRSRPATPMHRRS